MHKVTPKFPKKRTILPEKLHSSPLSGTLSHCPQPSRRYRRGCQPHRPSLPPAARYRFQPDDAVRCTCHRSALHRSSQHAAWALAAHCIFHQSILPASSPSPPGGSLPRRPAPVRRPMMPRKAAPAPGASAHDGFRSTRKMPHRPVHTGGGASSQQ